MSIAVDCTGCGKQLRVKDEFLGKRLKCPQCGATFTADAVLEDGVATDDAQKFLDKLIAQWPAVLGLICIVVGLVIMLQAYTTRLGLAVMGAGVASIGYWALSSSNRDYNF